MKILIGVTACHKFDYDMTSIDQCMVLYRQGMDFTTFRPPIIRETWWKDVPSEIGKKFFYGKGATRAPLADEVFLPVDDKYASLPYKTRSLCAWALDQGYTHLFKCDDDTFVYVDRLLKSGFESYPWIGRYNGGTFVAGGPGYWLDTGAMKVISCASIRKDAWAEDIWVSNALLAAGYAPHFDSRYVDLRRGKVASDTVAVCECPRDVMTRLYKGK